MRLCFYYYQVTPHLLPFAKAMAALLGKDNVRYIYTSPLSDARKRLGWLDNEADWVVYQDDNRECAKEWLDNAEVVVCEQRDLEVWASRVKSGKKMYYTSERWYKPILLFRLFGRGIYLPGILRLLSPRFFKMARALCHYFKSGHVTYLADGPYAAEDFVRTLRLMSGSWRYLLHTPSLKHPSMPFDAYDIDEDIRMWGYFVEPSDVGPSRNDTQPRNSVRKVLWVGRFLYWKRVDTLIKAVKQNSDVELDLYGVGPEEMRLRALASGCPRIRFFKPVSVLRVRQLMREHDVYVLPSNSWEGWGAVVNEALEEGMIVIGSVEAGATRAMLPRSRLFHCHDVEALSRLLMKTLNPQPIGFWGVDAVARRVKDEL